MGVATISTAAVVLMRCHARGAECSIAVVEGFENPRCEFFGSCRIRSSSVDKTFETSLEPGRKYFWRIWQKYRKSRNGEPLTVLSARGWMNFDVRSDAHTSPNFVEKLSRGFRVNCPRLRRVLTLQQTITIGIRPNHSKVECFRARPRDDVGEPDGASMAREKAGDDALHENRPHSVLVPPSIALCKGTSMPHLQILSLSPAYGQT